MSDRYTQTSMFDMNQPENVHNVMIILWWLIHQREGHTVSIPMEEVNQIILDHGDQIKIHYSLDHSNYNLSLKAE